ncbi:MAG: PSD1 and planctomycete cytochrome C domain-containing protein [Planctomycetaceae bacterium]
MTLSGRPAFPPFIACLFDSRTLSMRFAHPLVGVLSLCCSMAMLRSDCVLAVDPAPAAAVRPAGDDLAGVDFFERKIRPVLVKHCYGCHSTEASSVKGGLKLDSRDALRAGGDSGPAVIPGDPDGSLLIAAIRYESTEMPPDGKLDEQVVADFVNWIERGAVDPRESDSLPSESVPSKGVIDWTQAANHWAFQRPQRSSPAAPPARSDHPDWAHQPLDAHVLAKLSEAKLRPTEAADRATLLRRVSLDITGLPPTMDDVRRFVADPSPAAYERAVERLLGSVHYGERWARLWLDIVRYAEDQAHIVGDNKELFYPNAYLYRDWVIHSLNCDMPYDRFCRLQLAADLIEPDDSPHLVALGMIGLGPKYYRRGAPEVMADEWEDRVDTVTRGLLGLTVACARCHDHKYDPIPTSDYYAIAGVFASTEMFNRPLALLGQQGSSDQDDSPQEKAGRKDKAPEESMHIVRDVQPRDLNIMIRGDVTNQGPVVPRGFLSVLGNGERTPFTHGSGRLELANAIACRQNPLTARVIVNRVWGELIGQPLVSTPSNFGMRGSSPTHPELLDDLAVRFMDNGWSLKWLVREITLSSTYRQSSRIDQTQYALDPANRLISRANRRRLSAELWRDRMLAASGGLDLSVGGTSIVPSDPLATRRTVYSVISRFQLDPFLSLMDFPDPNAHSERRSETTTPIQKLFALNSGFMVEQAKRVAARVVDPPQRTSRQRIDAVYELVFARRPDEDEVKRAMSYLKVDPDNRERWAAYAQALLASNEFLIVD